MSTSGTYISVKVQEPTSNLIESFIKTHKIPRSEEDFEQPLHVTLIRSKKDGVDLKINPTQLYLAQPGEYRIFVGDGKQRLTFMLNSPQLFDRHNEFIRNHSMVSDYEEFLPHVTIAYDIGSYSWWNLPRFIDPVVLSQEHAAPRNFAYKRKGKVWSLPQINWDLLATRKQLDTKLLL